MKTRITLYTLISIITFLQIFLFSCDENATTASNDPATHDPAVIADWNIVRVIYVLPDTTILLRANEQDIGGKLDIFDNGRFEYNEYVGDNRNKYKGTWEAKDGKMTLTPEQGSKMDYVYALVQDREFNALHDTLWKVFQGTYNNQPATVKYEYERVIKWSKEVKLVGKWNFVSMDINTGESTKTLTADEIGLVYTYEFLDDGCRVDSTAPNDTASYFYLTWGVNQNKIQMSTSKKRVVVVFSFSDDELLLKFRGLHEGVAAIFTQRFRKI